MDNTILGGIILRGLGERLNGIQEVSGSIPLISTKLGSLGTESLEIYRFQGLFVFVASKKVAGKSCDLAFYLTTIDSIIEGVVFILPLFPITK